MTEILKHEPTKTTRPTIEHTTPAITLDVDMTGVEVELANLARYVLAYVNNAVTAENSLCLFSGPGPTYSPLRLVLEGDAVDTIADSLKRIADAMAAPK